MNRRTIINGVKYLFTKRSLALMYHRIGDVGVDPWQLTVSPENFDQQLRILSQSFILLRASELVAQVNKQSLVKKGVCITFDDGYQDNYLAAKPLLESHRCPATFFIATGYTGRQEEFWWDALVGLLLLPERLPPQLELMIDGALFSYSLANDGVMSTGDLEKHKTWIWPNPAPTQRCEIYLDIWERLKPLPFDKIRPVLKALEAWAGDYYRPDPQNFPMSGGELDKLFSHPLIDTGIHTMTHPALGAHEAAFQRSEIAGAKSQLDDKSGKNHDLLAYPYGNHNSSTLQIAGELKLAGAFTTSETAVNKHTTRYQIGRFQVKNWDGETFKKQLSAWFAQ